MEVAKHGYGLDTLIYDQSYLVRMEVAKHGYGLNKLVNDNHKLVRKTAKISRFFKLFGVLFN